MTATERLDRLPASMASIRTNHVGQPVVREYGCRLCQDANRPYFHREHIDAEYRDHILFQGRNHGPADRIATPNEVLAMGEKT